MAKDPAFLFYTNDFLSGTQFMTDDQLGKYMRMLMAQHQHGHLTEDQVKFICKSYDNHVMLKFTKDKDGLWFNERLEIEIIKRKKFVESRSKNKEGKTKTKNTSESYENHMVNIDRNKNKIDLKIKEAIANELFSDDLFMESLQMTHGGKDHKQAFEECFIHHSNAPNPPTEAGEWKQKLNTWLINTKHNDRRSNKTNPSGTKPKEFGNAKYKGGLRG